MQDGFILLIILVILKNTPKGIRIPVTSVKGKCPRPLDDGGIKFEKHFIYSIKCLKKACQ